MATYRVSNLSGKQCKIIDEFTSSQLKTLEDRKTFSNRNRRYKQLSLKITRNHLLEIKYSLYTYTIQSTLDT